MTRRGVLLVVEGIDGAGKTTLVRALARALRREGVPSVVRREPADVDLGRRAQTAGDPWVSAVYFTLDRYLARPSLEHALASHRVVLQDRSYFSTLAYQGSQLGRVATARLTELQEGATVPPDLVVLLDLPPAQAMVRLGRRGSERGAFERQRTLARVARAYRSLAQEHGWLILDARRPTAELASAVRARLGPLEGAARRPPKKIRGTRLPRRRR